MTRRGFTLIEVLVAITIVGVIGVTVLGAFTATMNAGEGVSSRSELNQIARFIVRKMTEDLKGATLLEHNGLGEFVGTHTTEGEVDTDAMVFTTFGRRIVYAGRGGDQALVRWYVVPVEGEEGHYALRRSENPFVTDIGTNDPAKEEDWEVTDALRSLTIRYLGAGVEESDSYSSKLLAGQLPRAVDVAFELADDKGRVIRHTLFVTLNAGGRG